ncbi:S41 family peptidase [Flavobacterium fluviatile]|uniref:S41 family peptidase n=1 Tax=Flavobacterium fluviatile TaxID=1862387 RepID=UPI0013CFA393|nr:S41 family peptidase [Flavobacterium fluviatile]
MKKSISVLLSVVFFVACQTDDDIPKTYEEGTNEYVNDWIYTQMKRYYYWNQSMPGRGNLSLPPKEYFGSLVNKNDRFSYAIHTSSAETFPQSLRNSFGFDFSFIVYEGQVYGVVMYVLSNSPAERNGLERGNLISAIDGTAFNQGNYNSLYQDLSVAKAASLQIVTYSEKSGFTAAKQINISQGFTLLQPVLSHVIPYQNHKVGYVEIPHFDVGLSQSLLNVFQDFKNQSVTEVVVDLRYNGGGDVSSAAALSILLAPNIRPADQFIRFKGNSNGGEVNQTFQESLEMNESKVSFEALRAAHPQIRRVYVLCSNHTASASEIIINNLKPFMEVITIGEKTVGKDVASFPIEDDRIAGIQAKWILYPAIYKLFNANGEGNYASGIQPTIMLEEFQGLEVFPLGNTNEILLRQALNSISGNGSSMKSQMIQTLQKQKPNVLSEPLIIKKGVLKITGKNESFNY